MLNESVATAFLYHEEDHEKNNYNSKLMHILKVFFGGDKLLILLCHYADNYN